MIPAPPGRWIKWACGRVVGARSSLAKLAWRELVLGGLIFWMRLSVRDWLRRR